MRRILVLSSERIRVSEVDTADAIEATSRVIADNFLKVARTEMSTPRSIIQCRKSVQKEFITAKNESNILLQFLEVLRVETYHG